MWITIPGVQGHVAYPDRAANPITRLGRVLTALDALALDQGSDSFQASNLEVTDVDTGNIATNVIPGSARARLHIRFNNLHRGEDLVDLVRRTVEAEAPGAIVEAKISGEAFLTPPGALYELVTAAIAEETGIEPELSTGGGTSDGRFLIETCPVVDFGLPTGPCTSGRTASVADNRRPAANLRPILRAAFG